MATVTLEFDNPINESLQAKALNIATATSQADEGAWDIIYYVSNNGSIIRLGECIAIDTANNSISVEVDNSVPRPSDGNFVFFGKDVQAGTSGVIGYYAQVQMRNDSTDRAELFAVSSEIFISSK